MTKREFTVKLKPRIGESRAQLCVLLPAHFDCGHSPSGSIVEVTVLRVQTARLKSNPDYPLGVVYCQWQLGDMPHGGIVVSENSNDVEFSLSTRVPPRCGWNFIVCFYEDLFGMPQLQTEKSDHHVVVRVSSRPA